MADEPDAPSGEASAEHPHQSADADSLAARLAEVHRRTEELAAQVASFEADTNDADRAAPSGDGAGEPASDQGGDRPRPRPRPAPQPEPAAAAAESAAPESAAPESAAPEGAQRPRPRPRPTTAPDTNAEPKSTPDPEPDPEPEPEPKQDEAKPKQDEAKPKQDEAKPKQDEAKPKQDEAKAEPESTATAAPAAAGAEAAEEKPKRFQRKKAESADGDKPDKDGKSGAKESAGKGMPSWLRRIRTLVILVVVVVAAALALRAYVVAPFYVPSASMEPTLHGCPNCNDDHVLVQKLSYDFHDPERTDIIVFDRPSNWKVKDGELIKRVIGVPGDKIVIKHGRVFVNGARLDEPYVNKKCHGTGTDGHGATFPKVPKGKLFVMGDNRCDSEDSRTFGPIPIDNVVGKAFLIIYPFGRFGSL